MCSWFRLIRLFTLLWLFSVLLGLRSASALDAYFPNCTNAYTADGIPHHTAGAAFSYITQKQGTSGRTVYYSQNNSSGFVVSVSGLGWAYSCSGTPSCSNYSGTSWDANSVSCVCPSGKHWDSASSSCAADNPCISGVTVAGTGYPSANPGYSGVGKQITYCDSAKCVNTAWESLNITYCPDNSPSCPPVTISRSEGTLTGAQCATPNVPSNPTPECAGGMSLLGGVCVCPAGARLESGVCRQKIDCSVGYHRVDDKCIADACPSGEIVQDNKCVPDPRSTVKNNNPQPGEPPIACAAGRHYDSGIASCVSNNQIGSGTTGDAAASAGTKGAVLVNAGGSGGGSDNSSASSSDCSAEPVCTGDAVQCALLRQTWVNHCESVPQSIFNDHPVPPIESVDLSTSAIASLNAPAALTFAAVCPADKNFSIMGHSYVLSWQPACDGATYLKPIIIAIGFLHGLYVVFSIRKGE